MESTLTVHGRAADPAPLRLAPQLFLVLECSRPLALSVRYVLDGVDVVRREWSDVRSVAAGYRNCRGGFFGLVFFRFCHSGAL